jgi:chromosome segregation ATPase
MTMVLIAISVSFFIVFGALFFFKFQLKKSMSGSTGELQQEITSLNKKLAVLQTAVNSYGSKEQFEQISSQKESAQADLAKYKNELIEAEKKLQKAQKDIELKENEQQDLKLNKTVDENKLQELMASFADMSSESEALEKKIAQSMDNLDNLKTELKLTQEQAEMLERLANALSTAGSLLRDLIGEQQGVSERLNMLESQHNDLEEEYTRLVEQQLGE